MATIPQDSTRFLSSLLQTGYRFGQPAYLTLTAIHPDGNRPIPSRHIAITNIATRQDALRRLLLANQMGWGAYLAIGLRKGNLGRWRRGGNAEVLALPALYTDLDDPSATALELLRSFRPLPSCITFTGGGFHAYWWLAQPLFDLDLAARLLRTIGRELKGDPMSISQILRLPGSVNTKPKRNRARCRIVELQNYRYTPENFNRLLPKADSPVRSGPYRPAPTMNPALIQAVVATLYRQYGGFDRHNGWIGALCPLGHKRDRPGQHFSFNPKLALGVCQGRHQRILLKALCAAINLNPQDYGGLYEPAS